MVTGSGVEAQWWGRYSRIVKMSWFNIFFCIIKVKEVVHCYCAPNVQMSNCEFTAKSMGQRLKFCVGWGGRDRKGGGYRIWSYIEHVFFYLRQLLCVLDWQLLLNVDIFIVNCHLAILNWIYILFSEIYFDILIVFTI